MISSGVLHSVGLIEQATAREACGLTFLQISDSHINFKSPYPSALATLGECIAKIDALKTKPQKVPLDKLRRLFGIANVAHQQNEQRLAISDQALKA